MDIKGAFNRPFQNATKLLIGVLMYFIPILNIVTGLFANGYVLNSAELTMKKSKKMPEWKKWGSLFWKGIVVFIISAIYMVPSFIVFIIALIISGVTITSAIATGEWFEAVILMMGSLFGLGLLFLIVFFLSVYVLPAAILGYVSKWKFREAFRFKVIRKKAFNEKYFLAWLLSIALAMAAGLIFQVSLIIPFAFIIVAPALYFIYLVIVSTLMAQAYSESK